MHRNGVDYLIPSSADTRSKRFASRCLEIGFKEYIEDSTCGNVLIVVDACREGVHLQEKGSYSIGWSRQKQAYVGNRIVSYLYACSEGEWARYVKSEIGSYSVLSRAFNMVAMDESGPSTLDSVVAAVRINVEDITSQNSLPRQRIQLVGDVSQTKEVTLFGKRKGNNSANSAEHSWIRAVNEHEAWKLAVDDAALKQDAVRLVKHCAELVEDCKDNLADDPWWDEQLATRTNDRLNWLLTRVLNSEKLAQEPGGPALTASEAALLAAFPVVHATFWARATVKLREVVDEKVVGDAAASADFERFTQRYPRLARRAGRLNQASVYANNSRASRDIRWWLFHRWQIRRISLYETQTVKMLLKLDSLLLDDVEHGSRFLAEVFDAQHLGSLIRSMRMTAIEATRSDNPRALALSRSIAMATPQEQELREQVIGLLLIISHLLAIEPASISVVVAEHIGIADPVNLEDLLETIRRASWRPRGRTRVLNAECTHQAVDVALNEHAIEVTNVLQQIDTLASEIADLAPLSDLPTHASADEVRSAFKPGGGAIYDGQGFRFRLADDRIQELLMGEQLYGDPALAVRELYQNALDACRYRTARTEYLRRTNVQLPEWHGEIAFEQGTDISGRRYLDCIDNGIGMGRRELTDVFSNAGVRFADLPEFIEEKAKWKELGISFHENSAFGVGVLSYFMIADEIVVTTCRLTRTGQPGRQLKVNIPGPGAVSRIQDLGPSNSAGTVVRLILRDDDLSVSCVRILSRVLWISEYEVVARDNEERAVWEPNKLSPVAPIGSRNPFEPDAQRKSSASALSTSTPAVWWCNSTGGILADGLWVGKQLFGAIVNLTGDVAPKLTVDRRQIVDYDTREVNRLLAGEIDRLFNDEEGALRTHPWIWKVAKDNPEIADEIIERATADDTVKWFIADSQVGLPTIGYFPLDNAIFGRDKSGSRQAWMRLRERGPDWIFGWRLNAWASAGLLTGVTSSSSDSFPVARPSDLYLLTRSYSRDGPKRLDTIEIDDDLPPGIVSWLALDRPVPLGHVLAAAEQLQWSPRDIVARLTEFGFTVTEFDWSRDFDRTDATLLSKNLNRNSPWLDSSKIVPIGHIVAAAEDLQCSPVDIVRRLVEFGFTVTEFDWSRDFDRTDTTILSENLDNKPPWLVASNLVPAGHVIAAALQMDRPVKEIIDRLTSFDLAVADFDWSLVFDRDDIMLFSKDLDRARPWLTPGENIRLSSIFLLSFQLDWTPEKVRDRLVELGFAVPSLVSLSLSQQELATILSRDLDRSGPWLRPAESVEIGHVFAAAGELGSSPERVAGLLADLGMNVPEYTWWQDFDRNDALLISRNLDRTSPWLELDEPVSAGHVLAAAAELGYSPEDVRRRLSRFGFEVAPIKVSVPVERSDIRLLASVEVNSDSRWLSAEHAVSARHILLISTLLGRPVGQVASRLVKLGFQLPPFLEVLNKQNI